MASFGFNKSPEAILAQGESGEIERRLYDMIVPENRSRAMQPRAFEDHYGKEAVERDIAYVVQKEAEFAKQDEQSPGSAEMRRRGELFEAIVNSGIGEYSWFGKNAESIVPSRYDDIKNGIDSIVIFKIPMGHSTLALTVDVTKDAKSIEEKLAKIRTSIESGKLSTVKYFEYGGFRGEQLNVPRVVIGADQESVLNISELLVRAKNMARSRVPKEDESSRKVHGKLSNHPLRSQIIDEMRMQLRTFEAYAKRAGKDGIAKRYGDALALVDHAAQEESIGEKMTNRKERDTVYQTLKTKLARFGK